MSRPVTCGQPGCLVADAIELTEHNDSLLVAEPLGSQAWLWFGRELQDVPPETGMATPGFSPLHSPTLFHFQPAYAASAVWRCSDRRASTCWTRHPPWLDTAFAYEGSASDEGLSGAIDLGDISGDGASDLMLVGESSRYVLFGPVDLAAVEDVATAAEFSVDLDQLGRPAERVGDLDGDGFADLLFVRTDTTRQRIPTRRRHDRRRTPRLAAGA